VKDQSFSPSGRPGALDEDGYRSAEVWKNEAVVASALVYGLAKEGSSVGVLSSQQKDCASVSIIWKRNKFWLGIRSTDPWAGTQKYLKKDLQFKKLVLFLSYL